MREPTPRETVGLCLLAAMIVFILLLPQDSAIILFEGVFGLFGFVNLFHGGAERGSYE